MIIRTDDILGFLVADTCTPSTFGAQLDRLRWGLTTAPDPHRAREEAESHILQQAELLRCMDDFKRVPEFRPSTTRSEGFKTLEKLQRVTSPRLCQGAIALNILRVYQRWGNAAPERGFVAVYGYVSSIAERIVPPIAATDALEATQLFREGKAKRAHQMTTTAYADSLLALGSFLVKYAKKPTR